MMLMSDSILMRLSRYQTMWSSSMPMNSSIASSADRFDSTAAIAFVSDEYEERDSTSRLTAFALNSPVYLVPLPWFHHLPSRQGKYGTKISSYQWQSWSNCD